MARYIGRRLLYMIVTLFVIVVLTFVLMKILPGSPFDTERFEKLTPEQQAAALERYGLDKPIPVQFLRYLGNTLRGDLGTSFYYTNIPVTRVIFSRLGPSMLVGAQAILVGLAIGLSLGIVAACRHNGFVDNFTMVIAVLGISVPNFVVAALLQYYVGLKLGWLPIGFWKTWSCSVLPSLALCFQPLATAARFIRTETLDVLQQDHHHGLHGGQPAHGLAGDREHFLDPRHRRAVYRICQEQRLQRDHGPDDVLQPVLHADHPAG